MTVANPTAPTAEDRTLNADAPAVPESNPGKPADTAAPAKKKGKKGGKPKEPLPEGSSSTNSLVDAVEIAKRRALDSQTASLIALGWKPTANAIDVPIKSLCRDKHFQMRNTGSDVYDETTVETYKDLIKEGAVFPPVKVIKITDNERKEHNLTSCLVVWDGFQTSEATSRAGRSSVSCLVMDGNYRFARLLALGANATHGKNRTDADKRKAVKQIVDDETLQQDAIALSERNKGDDKTGGLNRAIAFVTGTSKGHVSNVLKAMGLTTKGNKIVKAPNAAAVDPETPAPAAGSYDPNAVLPPPVMSMEEMARLSSVKLLEQMDQAVASVERMLDSITYRADVRDAFLEYATEEGIPMDKDTVQTPAPEGTATPGIRELFTWPVLNQVAEVIDKVRAKILYPAGTAPVPATV